MKVLVISAHPCIENSRVNKALVNEFKKRSNVKVHELCKEYPEMDINVKKEQELLLENERIVFLFPLYWYSSPAILKLWMDMVFEPGFAYGIDGNKLHGKEFMIITSIGSGKECYRAGGHNNFTVDELLRPFQQSVNYIGGKYISPCYFFKSILATENEIHEESLRIVNHAINDNINPRKEHTELVFDSTMAIISRLSNSTAEYK